MHMWGVMATDLNQQAWTEQTVQGSGDGRGPEHGIGLGGHWQALPELAAAERWPPQCVSQFVCDGGVETWWKLGQWRVHDEAAMRHKFSQLCCGERESACRSQWVVGLSRGRAEPDGAQAGAVAPRVAAHLVDCQLVDCWWRDGPGATA
jgi:hypothetical protein